MRYLLLSSLLLISCTPCYERDYNFTNYHYTPTTVTELGINLYDPNGYINQKVLDETTKNVLECVKNVWPRLTKQDKANMFCYNQPHIEIKPCLTVYVPDDWHYSECSGEQVFPCSVPKESCLVKGQVPNENCPCSCRAMRQDTDIIVTAPNLIIYPQELTRLLTTCYYPYGSPLEECVGTNLIYKE